MESFFKLETRKNVNKERVFNNNKLLYVYITPLFFFLSRTTTTITPGNNRYKVGIGYVFSLPHHFT